MDVSIIALLIGGVGLGTGIVMMVRGKADSRAAERAHDAADTMLDAFDNTHQRLIADYQAVSAEVTEYKELLELAETENTELKKLVDDDSELDGWASRAKEAEDLVLDIFESTFVDVESVMLRRANDVINLARQRQEATRIREEGAAKPPVGIGRVTTADAEAVQLGTTANLIAAE